MFQISLFENASGSVGILTDEDKDMLHGRVIDDINVKMPDSAKVRFATFFNDLRCMVNTNVVDAHLTV
jgi:hypothetical protein